MITRKPEGPYLIQSSPDYGKRCVFLAVQRFALSPSSIVRQFVAAYHDELRSTIDSDAIYLGAGK